MRVKDRAAEAGIEVGRNADDRAQRAPYRRSGRLSLILAAVIVAVLCVGSVGCATNSDLDSLRQELDETRRLAEQAKREAEAAATAANSARADAQAAANSAQISAAEAQEATVKAERIFQKALRK